MIIVAWEGAEMRPVYYEPPFDLKTCTGRQVLAIVLPKHDVEIEERHSLMCVLREEETKTKPASTIFECSCGAYVRYSDNSVREDFSVGPMALFKRLKSLGYDRRKSL